MKRFLITLLSIIAIVAVIVLTIIMITPKAQAEIDELTTDSYSKWEREIVSWLCGYWKGDDGSMLYISQGDIVPSKTLHQSKASLFYIEPHSNNGYYLGYINGINNEDGEIKAYIITGNEGDVLIINNKKNTFEHYRTTYQKNESISSLVNSIREGYDNNMYEKINKSSQIVHSNSWLIGGWGNEDNECLSFNSDGSILLYGEPVFIADNGSTRYYSISCDADGYIVVDITRKTISSCFDDSTFPLEKIRGEAIPTNDNLLMGQYADLGLSVDWAYCNIGAVSQDDYGNYYAFGETKAKSNYSWATYMWSNGNESDLTKYCTLQSFGRVDNELKLLKEDDIASLSLGNGWRIPTDYEWAELMNNCTWNWTSLDDHDYEGVIEGYLITSKKNGNTIFLPAAGNKRDNTIHNAGSDGDYWSSCIIQDKPSYAWNIDFNSHSVTFDSSRRCYGFSIRAVRDK